MPAELENISKKMRELVDGMKSSFQKASANISGHIGEVMSDEIKMTTETIKSFASSAKESSMKILKFFGTGWTLELKSFAVDKKQLDVLEDIKRQGEEEKLSRLARFKKSKGGKFLAALLDLLGIPLAILAAGIAAVIGSILLPFKAIYKILKPLLKLFGWITRLSKLFTKIAAVGKIAKMIKAFKWLGSLFTFFLKLPGLRVIAAGLKFGFTKLLWPLQILLSVIDFVRGFSETQGTLWEKIKGGLKNALVKFMELPLRMIGGIWDWILNALGLKKEGDKPSADKFVEGYGNLIDDYFGLMEKIFGGIKVALRFIIDVLKEVNWKETINSLNEMRDWIDDLPDKIKNFIDELLDKAKFWKWGEDIGEDKIKVMPGPGSDDPWATTGGTSLKLERQTDELIRLIRENNGTNKKILEKENVVPFPVDTPRAPAIAGPDNAPVPQFTSQELSKLF